MLTTLTIRAACIAAMCTCPLAIPARVEAASSSGRIVEMEIAESAAVTVKLDASAGQLCAVAGWWDRRAWLDAAAPGYDSMMAALTAAKVTQGTVWLHANWDSASALCRLYAVTWQ